MFLSAWPYYLPKENPKRPLGQDAFFISSSNQTIGVADGVSGIIGVDSGVYARELMSNAHDYINRNTTKTVDPMSVLKVAFSNSNSRLGASTAIIIALKENSLHAANLGDSQFMIIRGEKTVYKSPVQEESFNCPFQLGCSSRYTPRHAEKIVVGVEAGDVIVAGTDGLFDNLFDAEIEEIVKTTVEEGKPMAEVALVLAKTARQKSLIADCITPFSVAAAKNGRKHSGGKDDDITVIFGCIEPNPPIA